MRLIQSHGDGDRPSIDSELMYLIAFVCSPFTLMGKCYRKLIKR